MASSSNFSSVENERRHDFSASASLENSLKGFATYKTFFPEP